MRDDPALYLRTLDGLPPGTRTAFLLHLLDDLDYPQIAFRLNVGIDEVTRRIARALSELCAALDDETEQD